MPEAMQLSEADWTNAGRPTELRREQRGRGAVVFVDDRGRKVRPVGAVFALPCDAVTRARLVATPGDDSGT